VTGVEVPVLVITGAVGVGKTTVSYEVRLQLRDAGVSCVLIDDEFALFHPRPAKDPIGTQTSTRALASLWLVYQEAGIERVILASMLESSSDLDRIRGSRGRHTGLLARRPVLDACRADQSAAGADGTVLVPRPRAIAYRAMGSGAAGARTRDRRKRPTACRARG
jgi:RecA/RadA recombinase